jgi:hypothetical protein
MIETMSKNMEAMQQQIIMLQNSQPHSSYSTGPWGFGENHGDQPPRFQKMDFPKFDDKTDPLAFLNRCESFFHQQRIAAEEQVWMASYNLEGGA